MKNHKMQNYYEAFQTISEERISKPGEYCGYSQMKYDGFKYFSQYVTMRDGINIAVTYYRPTLSGELVETPLPVIWRFTPYGRILYNAEGKIKHTVFFSGDGAGMGPSPKIPDDYVGDRNTEEVQTGADLMIRVFTSYGYILAQADVRGKFASYGFRKSSNTDSEADDAYEINEWLANQPWCDGNVGMFGSSYTGQTQLSVLRKAPPHLRAAVISMTDIDKFDGWRMGGIARGGDINMNMPDNKAVIVPVDEDKDGSMLAKAMEQHKLNQQDIPVDDGDEKVLPYYKYSRLAYRNSFSKISGTRFWIDDSASTHLEEINKSAAAVYLIGGWYDVFRRDTVTMFNNLTLPKKMIIGPWYHTRYKDELNLLVEHLRFYDYWLKGIDNGVMSEPPIYMKTMNSEKGQGNSWEDGWSFENAWPLSNTHKISYFLGKGTLGTRRVEDEQDYDVYISNYSVDDWEEQDFADDILKKGIVYTSSVLEHDVCVTGHPEVMLNFTSSGHDADFFIFLMEQDENNMSHLISMGKLRASLRSVSKAPYNTIGLPWHPCRKEDVVPVSFENGPIELRIDMKPTSYVFKAGKRVQLAITSSLSRFQYYREDPAPTVHIYRNDVYPSRLVLPIKEIQG